ncbi:MAG: hypothetical protein IT347_04770 [Candidatus Eisenbacteria bacterium]|nr:hypothetical protein [Candidatus Eisenbacteria bacterium]
MSASWASRNWKRAAAALAVLAVVSGSAAADVVVHRGGDSGEVVRRVRISNSGVIVVKSGSSDGDSAAAADSSADIALHGDGGAGMVRLFSDANVAAGEQLDGDVVAVFGSVHVAGNVSGSVVAVFGSVEFEPGASVDGDAVAVGGAVQHTEGVRIGGQTVSIGLAPLSFGLPGVPVMLAFLALGWIVTLFFGWVFAALFPERLVRVAVTSSRRTLLSLVLGLLAFLVMPVAAILLIVTVIGLPIGIMLPFVYVALVYAGQIAGTYVLGCKLTRRPLDGRGAMRPILAGTLLVGCFFAIGVLLWSSPGTARTFAVFFHLVGLLVMTGLSVIGSGAFLLSRLGTRPLTLGDEPAAANTTAAGAASAMP